MHRGRNRLVSVQPKPVSELPALCWSNLAFFPSQVARDAFPRPLCFPVGARKSESVWEHEICWKKAFRCGRCILIDAGKTHPNKGNYELLKTASSRC